MKRIDKESKQAAFIFLPSNGQSACGAGLKMMFEVSSASTDRTRGVISASCRRADNDDQSPWQKYINLERTAILDSQYLVHLPDLGMLCRVEVSQSKKW